MSQRFALNLSESDWNAIRAALWFWLATARTSSVHPAETVSLKAWAAPDGQMREIAERPYSSVVGLISADDIAGFCGWTRSFAKRWLAKQKIRPVRGVVGSGIWYDREQVEGALRDNAT